MIRFYFILAFFILAWLGQGCQNPPSSEGNAEETVKDSTSLAIFDTTAQLATAPVEFDSANYNFVNGQLEVSWKILAQVEFEEKYNEEVQAYVPYPKFEPIVQALDGKEIIIQGYLIPVDESGSDDSILVLSANPFSSCFFCGAAGPESVMDIMLKEKLKGIKTDRVATFKGRLKLNDSDLYYLNYILEDAELVKWG